VAVFGIEAWIDSPIAINGFFIVRSLTPNISAGCHFIYNLSLQILIQRQRLFRLLCWRHNGRKVWLYKQFSVVDNLLITQNPLLKLPFGDAENIRQK
jgi:hypothetical protein